MHFLHSHFNNIYKQFFPFPEILINPHLLQENMSAVDALYAVFNITGRDATWPVTKTESHACGGHEASRVHMDEMMREIREIFQVDEDVMEQLKNEALQRKPIEFTLNLTVKEARIRKRSKGNDTVYISVTTPSKHDNQDLMTSFIKSFAPKWDHEFSVPIRDHRKDHIYLQLWQNGEDELTWLIEPELATIYYPRVVPIATLSIPIMEVIETELNGWYEFESTVDTDIPNLDIESVKVHLSGHITCSSDLSEQHQSYDEFLLSLFNYHTSVSMDPSSELWQGTLPASLTALSTHSRILHNIRKNTQLISWCKASVQLPNVDAVHTLSLVKNIQTKIVESSYSKEDLDLLEDTLILIMEKYEERIRSLDSTFPFSNSDSERQLTAVLKKTRNNHSKTVIPAAANKIENHTLTCRNPISFSHSHAKKVRLGTRNQAILIVETTPVLIQTEALREHFKKQQKRYFFRIGFVNKALTSTPESLWGQQVPGSQYGVGFSFGVKS
ncbi:uncharacterized protein LOC122249296 [Penaeus japonicus]|uniref:uncharacterized protein LOC122249296 n=1 Tax=Penaeus japonicus TaxID=27405 RepID=UPI001C70F1C8|nr:uncharacterized protein LOC122249296 [Penaeus japonicus]